MSPTTHHNPAGGDSDADMLAPAREGNDPPRDWVDHPKAVKTFVFEVSAGRAKGVGDATTGRTLRIDQPLGKTADDSPADGAAPDGGPGDDGPGDDAPHAGSATDDCVAHDPAHDPAAPSPRRIPEPETWPVVRRESARERRRRIAAETIRLAVESAAKGGSQPRRLSAWSTSFFVHAVMAAALSLVTIAQIRPREQMDLVLSPTAVDDLQLAENASDADAAVGDEFGEQLEQVVNEASAQIIDPGKATLGMEAGPGLVGELTDAMALTSGAGGGAETGPPGGLGGAGGLFGDGTGGLADFGAGMGGEATAEFFGTKIDGRRIVFVLDNSGSMQQGRLETVVAELVRSVESLAENQEFYVIFYSDAAYPLFYPDADDRYIRPTARNKQRLAAWLDTVELCLGDAVVDALAAAISIEPDTVFLLSDGRIAGEKKMPFLLTAGGGVFPIHTVGVGLGSGATASRRNLQDIAASNGGEFREAAVPEEMRRLARDKPRIYHNVGPGPIWGRRVKAWGRP